MESPASPGPQDDGLKPAGGRPAAHNEPSRAPHSVLDAIERITGEAPRILLRDSDSKSGTSPMIDPSSSEKRSIPQGRGSYQILGEIARGGMGVVMKGHDTDLGRDVALKVLHKELAKRPEVLQRFVEEAQIGGQLQHPGIVPVYELGLMADERPYFTMKLVKGRTLAALLAERKGPTIDRRRMLDVFESVCQTMAYAHSRGVIHRDLKPANVMVGAFGEVQVVDWGLAKVMRQGGTADEKRQKQTNISIIETVRSEPGSHGSHSLVGSVMGTPAYMPPEQARGEIAKLDERSDVFSLGAILCEILTGAPPYVGESEKTLVQAASAKLDDATQRLDGCDADPELVALCCECLTPAQGARPRSAEVLAQRIHGHLVSVEDRARQAQVEAAEARVKAQEERRARKLTVGLAASVLVTVLVAGGGWAWTSSEKLRRERDTEAQVGAALNEATLKRGEGEWTEALAAVERAKGLAESDAASDELRARVAGDLAVIESETKVARANEELARDNAALLAELADVRQPEGDQTYPTDWAKVDADHRAIFARHGLELDQHGAVDVADALRARGISVELAAALDEWGEMRLRAEDKAGATYLSSLARSIDADARRSALRDALLASDIEELRTFVAMEQLADLPATTLHLLGKALRKNGTMDEAISVFRQAQSTHPSDFMLTMSLARALSQATPPLPEEAARYYTAALALRPMSIEAAHELGKTLHEQLRDRDRAIECFRTAVGLHRGDAHLRAHLANCFLSLGNLEASISTARDAVELDPQSAWTYGILGQAQEANGDLNGAIATFEKAIALDPRSADAYFNLGHALQNKGDVDGAIAAFEKAIERAPNGFGAVNNLGLLLRLKGDLDGAIAAFRKALEIEPRAAVTHGNLGLALEKKGDRKAAIACYRKSIEVDPMFMSGYVYLGNALIAVGDVDGALQVGRKHIELEPESSAAYVALGAILNDNKQDHDGAIAAFRKAIELDPKSSVAHYDLGIALRAAGDLEGAIAANRKAIELDPRNAFAYQDQGYMQQAAGDLDGAIVSFGQANEIDPRLAKGMSLGNALLKKGDLDAAAASYRKAIELDPQSVDARYNLGLVHERKGDLAAAVADYREALEIDPKCASAITSLGLDLQARGEFKGAIETYRKALEIDPKNGTWLNTLAWLLATCTDPALRDGAEAVRLAERQSQLTSSANTFNTLGVAWCCAGEWQNAIEALQHSIELTRGDDEFGRYLNAVNRCFLATAHAHSGEPEKARADYALAESWVTAHPKDASAAETARFLEDARLAIAAESKR